MMPADTLEWCGPALFAGTLKQPRLLSGAPFATPQVGKNLWFSLFVEATGFFDKAKHAAIESTLRSSSPYVKVRPVPRSRTASAMSSSMRTAGCASCRSRSKGWSTVTP